MSIGRFVTRGPQRSCFTYLQPQKRLSFSLRSIYSKVPSVILCQNREKHRSWRRCHTNTDSVKGSIALVALLGIGAFTGILGTQFHSENKKNRKTFQYPHNILTEVPKEVSNFVGEERVSNLTDSFLNPFLKGFLRNKSHDPELIIITGFSRVGKTQLALQFVKKYAQTSSRKCVIWIPCNNKQTIQQTIEQTFVKLYDTLEIGAGVYRQEIISQKEKIEEVKKALEKLSCLWVFDNASGMKAIADHLPKQGVVLVTSRNSCSLDWDHHKLYPLEPFKKDEIISFASQFLEDSQDKTSFLKSLEPLIKFLSGYPLVLNQLFSLLSKYTPEEFLILIRKKETLLEVLSNPNSSSEHAQSMKNVVKTALRRLRAKPGGEEANRLLSQLALLDCKDIPLKWVLTFDETDETLLKDHVRNSLLLLEKDSWIHWNRKTGSICLDRTIQLVIELLFSEDPVLPLKSSVLFLIDKWMDELREGTRAENRAVLLPHGRELFSHLEEQGFLVKAAECAVKLSSEYTNVHSFEESLVWAKKAGKLHEDLI